jgi:phage shock protein A
MIQKRRLSLGAESVEIALISAIALAVGIGAFLLFGDEIQTVFQNPASPVLMASNMNEADNIAGTGEAGLRTDIDKSLSSSSNYITKSYQDKSIGSEIGLETTGAAGGDAAIGGTYIVDDPSALFDGDPSTTGNALLDAALAAKASAENLVSSASNALGQANMLDNIVANMENKLVNETNFLNELDTTLTLLKDQLEMVTINIEAIVGLQAAANSITLTVADTLSLINGLNSSLVEQANNNTIVGNDILGTNQDYMDAYDAYQDLKDQYEAGWTTTCDTADPPVCSDTNTSGILEEDVLAAEAQAQMLLDNINGQVAGIKDQMTDLVENLEDLKDDAEDAGEAAEDLLKDSKKVLKEAFWNKHLFDHCNTIPEMISTAESQLAKGWGIKNKDAAEDAIELLYKALEAYTDWQLLEAQVQVAESNLDQLKALVEAVENGADTISFESSSIGSDVLVSTSNESLNFIVNSNVAVQSLLDQAADLDAQIIKVMQYIESQKSYISSLETQIDNTKLNAQDSQDKAQALVTTAEEAVDKADDVINDIVTFSGG